MAKDKTDGQKYQDRLAAMKAAFEAGYRAHERGENMESAWQRIVFGGPPPEREQIDLHPIYGKDQ